MRDYRVVLAVFVTGVLGLAADKSLAESPPSEGSLGYGRLKIQGTAQGGTLTIGHVGHPDVITIDTVAGQTSTQVMTTLADKINSTETDALGSAKLTSDGQAIKLGNTYIGSVVMRTTDGGIHQVGSVSNLTAAPRKADGKVMLSWTPPSPAPGLVVIHIGNMPLALVPGTSSSYEDEAFNGAVPVGDWRILYSLVCVDTENDVPVTPSDVVEIITDNPEVMPDDVFRVVNGELVRDLPRGVKDAAYGATLEKSGGVDPVSWTVSDGSLPDGLNLSTSGVISGAPTAVGTWEFTVTATDAAGATATKAMSITVTEYPLLTGVLNE